MATVLLSRRDFLLSGISLASVFVGTAYAESFSGSIPWQPGVSQLPAQVNSGPWKFFSPDEGAAIEALADRLIPEDELSPGGKDTGIATYIDNQLAGGFGSASGLYMQPPFADGLPGQGPQSALTPKQRYRQSLAALDTYCKAAFLGKSFADIQGTEQDKIIAAMENGSLPLLGLNSKAFFEILWQNTKEGFFADPVYGGNRNMSGWKMIGFPGTRYDYSDWIDHPNEPYPYLPVSMRDHPDWSSAKTGA